MNQDVLRILEFHEIRKMLVQVSPSPLSKEMALNLKPSTDPVIVAESLQETEEALICLKKEISTPLGETYDIRPIVSKIDKGMVILPQECMDLAASLETYDKMNHYFEGERHLRYPLLEEKSLLISSLSQLIHRIRQVFDEQGEISDRASPKLARIRSSVDTVKAEIRKSFFKLLHDKDQSSYFQDSIVTQRNGRYVVPVKEEYRYKFDGIVHDKSSTGQTLFMEPMSSVRLNNDLAELTVAEKQEIQAILQELSERIKKDVPIIQRNCKLATDIECIFARGKLALMMEGSKAIYSAKGEFDLRNARHPLIPRDRVVPISMTLGKSFRILIITGSNAGGKTIAIKTAGLLAAMNQSGLFIPASEGSTLPIYKHIYAIIGDDQSIQYNLSTFSSYVTQLASFLPQAGENDLVLLDELGSGTDPIEGAALAQAVVEYLNRQHVCSIITSHFSEMKKLAYEISGIENAFVEFDLDTLSPTYNLITGVAGNSNAFSICRRIGISDEILGRADELQKKSPLHNMENVMENLNQQMRDLEADKARLDKLLKDSAALKSDLNKQAEEFFKKRDAILSKARNDAEETKRQLRIQSEQIIKELKKKAAVQDKGEFLNQIAKIRGAIDDIKIPDHKKDKKPLDIHMIQAGMAVYIDTLDSDGEVISKAGRKVTVACGFATVTVDVSHCFRSDKDRTVTVSGIVAKRDTGSRLRREAVSTSLNIIGKTVSEAIPEVDRFLNDCFMSGVSPVQIIHGKGTGSLRRGIHDYLKTLVYVTEFHEAQPQNGGAGVTDVYF